MRLLAVLFSVVAGGLLAQGTADRVGWRFAVEWDASRSYAPAEGDLGPSSGRPVAITLWYPAANGGTVTTLADLARLGAYQRFGHPPATAFADATAQAIKDTAPDALSATARGRRDAPPRAGKYPAILFAHSTPLGQVAMAEALAARGFVVAGVMSRGATGGAYRLSIDDIRAMSDDLEFASRSIASLPFVDGARIGVIGMSNGALAAVGLANRTPIRAIVSLDGTIGEQAAARVLSALPKATTAASTPPVLHLYTTGNAYLDLSELQKWPAQCITVTIRQIRHADFLSYALLTPPVAGESAVRVSVADKFAAIQRLTAEFLQQLVAAGDSAARLDLRQPETALGLGMSPCSAATNIHPQSDMRPARAGG